MASVLRFRVVAHEDGRTLAQVVSLRMPDLTLANARALVKAGGVYLGHLRVRIPSNRVLVGERITVHPSALDVQELDPDELVFVHRDPKFVVLDKPPGVPVAATKASARGTLAEGLRRRLVSEGVVRPYVGVVHRLDQGASGLVMFTTRGVANKSVHAMFANHQIRRIYRVRMCGDVPDQFECTAALSPRPGSDSMRIAKPGDSRAKAAHTRFRALEAATDDPTGTRLVEVELETGRTHQIRVHAAELGFPVYGDRRYGSTTATPQAGGHSRLHLHAYRLVFAHPESGEQVDLASTLPDWAHAAST